MSAAPFFPCQYPPVAIPFLVLRPLFLSLLWATRSGENLIHPSPIEQPEPPEPSGVPLPRGVMLQVESA